MRVRCGGAECACGVEGRSARAVWRAPISCRRALHTTPTRPPLPLPSRMVRTCATRSSCCASTCEMSSRAAASSCVHRWCSLLSRCIRRVASSAARLCTSHCRTSFASSATFSRSALSSFSLDVSALRCVLTRPSLASIVAEMPPGHSSPLATRAASRATSYAREASRHMASYSSRSDRAPSSCAVSVPSCAS